MAKARRADLLDPRLSRPNSYIHDGHRLVRVLYVQRAGASGKLVGITGEDIKTLDLITLTAKDLEDFEFVCRAAILEDQNRRIAA